MIDTIICYDIETSGFVAGRHEIIEIGAIVYDGVIGDTFEFSRLIKPKEPISEKITELTGIDAKTFDKEGYVDLRQAVIDFKDLFEGRFLVVGHNLLDFDNKFLNTAFKSFGFPLLQDRQSWDTMLQMRAEIAKKKVDPFYLVQKDAKTFRTKQLVNLQAAAKHYKISKSCPHHRALPDAKNTFEIFKRQARKANFRY